MKNPEFFELIDSKRWNIIQEYFAQVIGASIRVVDTSGVPLTQLSCPHNYCFETVFSSSKAFTVCNGCLLLNPQPNSQDSLLTKKDHFLDSPDNIYYDSCPYFMHRIIIPIKDRASKVLAYIIIGPVILGKRRTYPEYFNLSKTLSINVNNLIDAVEQVRILSFKSAKSVAKLYQEIANYLAETGIQGKKPQPQIKKTDSEPANTVDLPFYVNKMLQALFETAAQGIDAERASLMLYDKDAKSLSIAMSKGIPATIINQTAVKKGEGIAGWAAKQAQVVFIDENFKQPRLMSRLSQPQLSVSLTVPLKSADKVFGVLNLSTRAKEHKFSSENINSIVQLTKMVDSTLVNINLDNLANA
jgi:hypothetical protein